VNHRTALHWCSVIDDPFRSELETRETHSFAFMAQSARVYGRYHPNIVIL